MVLLAVVATVGACSRSAPEDSRGPQERLLQSVFEQGSEDANSLAFDAGSAACAAHEVVEGIGVGRLQELGLDVPSRRGPELTEPPLTTAEGDVVFAAFDRCLDLVEQVGATIGADSGMPDDVADCVASAYVDSGVLREALLADGFDAALNGRIDSVLADAAQACAAT